MSQAAISRNESTDHRAVLLVGHGTRDERGREEFDALTRLVGRELPDRCVTGCYLELAEPTIGQALDRMAAAGGRQATVVPLLLFAAGHAKRDIPAEVEAGRLRHPQLTLRLASHLGCHSAILALSEMRYREAIAPAAPAPASIDEADPNQTLLLMVGRGSRDADANSEMARFSRLRFEVTPVGWIETCYTAMTEPSLARALALAGEMPFSRVVVQPHLLFQGDLVSRVKQQVAKAAAQYPHKQWLVTPHLGPDPRVAEAVLDRVREVEPAVHA